MRKKDEKNEWQFFDKKTVAEEKLAYKNALATGKYRLRVVAQAQRRLNSEPLYQEFETTLFANRSPAAIEQIKSEQSYESKSRFFALASYFISVVDYSSKNYDTNNQIAYSAVGGTGRLGAGFWFKEDGMWGVMTTIDMSGFTVANQTQTYLSGQLGAAIRYRLGAVGQLKGLVGVSYRELPTTLATSGLGLPVFTQTKVSSLGPTISVSLARGLTRKLGIQINGAISESTMDMGTPNGRAQEPRMSIQYGLLGSLRLSDSFIGFMGYAYREDMAAYRANSGSNINEVYIKGHYLNFMLEYGL
ncbi:MAG: hypothetical protein IPM57_12270 [Oligoflexia bacterium]|nr:hypothetical protein [Oligoflexia bacterium]